MKLTKKFIFCSNNISSKIFNLLVLFSFSPIILLSQQWKNWNTGNSGINTNSINSLAIDSSNNVWLATNFGITKFDGINWTIYNDVNSPLPNNDCFHIVSEGNVIWIGTVGGLVRFDGIINWTTYTTINSGLPFNYIVSLDVDKYGNKWIGTIDTFGANSGGLTKYDGANWSTYSTVNSGISSDKIYSTFVDRQDNKWICNSYGVDFFDNSLWSTYIPSNSGIPSRDVGNTKEDQIDGLYWITTLKGLALFDKIQNNWTVFDTSNVLPDNYIFDVEIDALNRKWVSCYFSGVAMFDNNSWTIYDSSNAGSFIKYAMNISLDSRGGIWLNTGYGLVYYGDTLLLNNTDSFSENELSVDVFPSPAIDLLNIKFNKNSSEASIIIYNISGCEVYRNLKLNVRSGFNEEVDVSKFTTGIYFCRIEFEKEVKISKIIVSP
ncbi:MAG: T9SS type A sorting domain-containing protein [Bacteroidota bacterium]